MDMLKTYGPHELAKMTYKDILKRREKANKEKQRIVDGALETMFTGSLARVGRKLGQCTRRY
ncbi:TPA: hypothetical protein I9080_002936 [Clostridium perfringens]|uniref:Uncharacterized protein n=1 Tax=Clostridium perfringens TaxID=1502 RepID=A0A8H9UY36_CLOPF|nr:hypothetical protein [Clostridium perfringens]